MSYYGVNRGLVPGVYQTWKECERNVKGFKGVRYKKFSTYEEAKSFSEEEQVVIVPKKHSHQAKENRQQQDDFNKIYSKAGTYIDGKFVPTNYSNITPLTAANSNNSASSML